MIAALKRYSMALVFMLFIALLMMGATLGVKSFGDKLFEDSNIVIQAQEVK